jgi:hypothetical protein
MVGTSPTMTIERFDSMIIRRALARSGAAFAMPPLGLVLGIGEVGLELAPYSARKQPAQRRKQPGNERAWVSLEDERHSCFRSLGGEQVFRTMGGAMIEGGEHKPVRRRDFGNVISSVACRPNMTRVSRKRVPAVTGPGVSTATL